MANIEKIITVGIPAFKAENHICDCLSSIQIQSIRDEVNVIIAKDNPTDNYEFVKERYPDLDITIIDFDKNTGPGLARQRCLDNCKTPWITWIDADDIFISPFSLESLKKGIFQSTQDKPVIEVQGTFYQEIQNHPAGLRMAPRDDVGHPWVFGRLYNVQFLKSFGIGFSELRAMEDGELNWKVRISIEGTPMQICMVHEPIYLWRTGSEHSITRIGVDENGIPQYNFDLCQWGATEACIRAIKFCRKKNPFNGSITRFTTEMMVGHYFTYVECLQKKPVFAEQNLFNAKKFYHECYKEIEKQIDDEVLKNMYTMQMASKAQDLIGIIPEITFFDFMKKVKEEHYGGVEEFKEIRKKLPQEIIDNDLKTGVLGILEHEATIEE